MNARMGSAPRSPGYLGPIIILVALCVALFGGLIVSYLPWFFVLGGVFLVAVVAAAGVRPHFALLFVLMLVFEVIPQGLQPRVPVGPGRLQLYDIVILLLSVLVLLRAWAQGQRPLYSLGPVRWPLYYLLACLSSSLIYVRFFAPNQLALAEARQQIMWLVVPLMVLSVDTAKRYRFMVWSIVAVGLIIALYVTIQSLFGIRIMTGARVEMLDRLNSDITRSIAGGGVYIVVFAFFLILNRMIEGRIFWLWAGLAALLLVSGLAVQFGRGVWIATTIGLLISAALFRGFGGVVRVVIGATIAIAIVFSAALVFKPRLAEAVADRLTGIGAEVESGQSFGWRVMEIRDALPRIEQQPMTGVGIGGDYRRTSHLSQETTYIHNGYLYFPLKMGLFAAFVPFAFIAAFVVTIRQAKSRAGLAADPGFVAALCGAFAVPVITSYTQPEWSATQGVAAYAILMGLALLYRTFGAMPRGNGNAVRRGNTTMPGQLAKAPQS